jgi:hypothetical protein
MALFPRIQSPCPYKGRLSDILDGSLCRLCKREVFDLTPLSDAARIALIAGCKGDICVTYAVPLRSAVAAAALAAAVVALPTAAAACAEEETVIITGGGITDPANLQYIQVPDAAPSPALPVVYEPAPAKAPS